MLTADVGPLTVHAPDCARGPERVPGRVPGACCAAGAGAGVWACASPSLIDTHRPGVG